MLSLNFFKIGVDFWVHKYYHLCVLKSEVRKYESTNRETDRKSEERNN